VRAFLHDHKPDFDQASLTQEVSHQILAAYGIPAPPIGLARSPEEAQQLAQKFGYPVALKIASPDIIHKSDLGGVILDQRNAQAVAESYTRITRNIQSARPGVRISGVHVQRMLPKGQEVIIGAVQDPLFGPLVMFGSGGVEVEGLKDVAFALAPLPLEEAERLVDITWAGRKLDGYRNLPPADRAAVLDVLMRLAQLVADLPELEEIEINPLLVLPQGEGAYALDVRGRYA
jgi:succinyl-CoA synthetase beta subunit